MNIRNFTTMDTSSRNLSTDESRNISNSTDELLWLDDDKDEFIRSAIGLVNGALGLPAIVLLIAVTLTKPYRKHSYSLYLTVMSFYDIIFVALEFSQCIFTVSSDRHLRDVIIQDVPCRVYEHLYYSSMMLSLWLNVALAADRLVVITFPLQRRRLCTRTSSWIVCIGLMLAIHGAGIVYIVYGGVEYFAEDDSYYCNGQEILFDIDLIMAELCGTLPAVILIVVCSSISAIKLCMVTAKRRKMTSSTSGKSEKTTRATIALVVIGIFTMITHIPNVCNEVFQSVLWAYHHDLWLKYDAGEFPEYDTAYQVFEGLKHINNIQSFFILYAMNSQFRIDVMRLVKCQTTSSTKSQSSRHLTSDTPNDTKERTVSKKEGSRKKTSHKH